MANKAMIGLGLQEDVSQGMQKIEDSIEGVSGKSKELAMIGKRIDDVSKKSLPARRELKQLEDIMANMNLKGLANTDEFTKAAVRAGELKDALSDTRQAVRAYSDDVMTLQAGAEVFQGIAAAGSIATSAMALFGTENEKVNQILLKVQAAQGLLNGVTSIANLLNKDSVIMLKLKQVQMAINSATTKKDTVLTTANTVAQTANTVATKSDTVAQTAWNTAKAIGNALLGNFSSLVLVGIGALATYAVATSGATDEQNKLNDEVDKGAEAQKGYKKVMADTYASLMTSFEQLKKGWNSLKTTHEKNKWITDNKNKLDELDLSINKVADAENVFNRNTSTVVASFIKRAKAAARLAELTDLYRKQMELLDKRSEILTKIGESSANTIKREIKEELGKDIEITGYISTIENFFEMKGSKYHEILFVHKGEFVNEEDKKIEYTLKNLEGKDYLQYEWLDISKIDEYPLWPLVIKDVIKENKFPVHKIFKDNK